jgi:hypothetical protein
MRSSSTPHLGVHWLGGWLDPESVWTFWRRENPLVPTDVPAYFRLFLSIFLSDIPNLCCSVGVESKSADPYRAAAKLISC